MTDSRPDTPTTDTLFDRMVERLPMILVALAIAGAFYLYVRVGLFVSCDPKPERGNGTDPNGSNSSPEPGTSPTGSEPSSVPDGDGTPEPDADATAASAFRAHVSASFELITDLPDEYAADILAELDAALPVYREVLAPHIRIPERAEPRHRVRVFASLDDFLAHRVTVWGEDPPANNFSYRHTDDPADRETIAYFTAREPMLSSLRHECFHQLLRREVANPAQWINEGLAESIEAGVGQVHRGWARTIREQIGRDRRYMRVPLADLLQLAKPQWLRRANVAYPMSWALVHYLREQSGDEGRATFGRLLAAMDADADEATNTRRVWRAMVGGADDRAGEPADQLTALQPIAAGFDAFLATVRPTPRYDDFVTARQLLDAGGERAALVALDRVIEADPQFAPAHHYRARTLSRLGRDHDALVAWLTALDIFPWYPASLIDATEAALELRRFTLAAALARETVVHARLHAALARTILGQIERAQLQPDLDETTEPLLPRFGGWPDEYPPVPAARGRW